MLDAESEGKKKVKNMVSHMADTNENLIEIVMS